MVSRALSVSKGDMAYLVSFVDELMSSSNQLQAVDMIKLRRYLVSKQPTSTTRANRPCFDIFGV